MDEQQWVWEAAEGACADEAAAHDLARRIAFLLEADKAKVILRQSRLAHAPRRENDGEHMWHAALAALILGGYAPPGIALDKVIAMLLVHDLVEIDAGDTFVYDEEAVASQPAREQAAAARLFGILPPAQAQEVCALWKEFERQESTEALFAAALDRLLPLLLNRASGGRSWAEHGIVASQVRERNGVVAVASPELGEFVEHLIQGAVAAAQLPQTSDVVSSNDADAGRTSL